MGTANTYERGEITGDNPGDLRQAVSELPQQLDSVMTPLTRDTEPVIELASERLHPSELILEPDTTPGMLRRYKKEILIGTVAVGAVLAAYAGVRLRKRRHS
jgi:hypothetical protein